MSSGRLHKYILERVYIMMCRLNYLRNSLCPADGKCLESKRMNARKKRIEDYSVKTKRE